MNKLERWKFLMPLTLAVFFFTAMVSGAWANELEWANEFEATNLMIVSTIDITRGSGTTAADRVDFGGNDDIQINCNGLAIDASCLSGEIIIMAPEGMMFVLDTSAFPGALIDATPADFAVLDSLPGITISAYTLIEEQYTDANGNLVNAVTGAKATILTVTNGADAYRIDFDQGGFSDLTVVPIPALGAKPMNQADKPFAVTANAGTSAEVSGNVGKVDVLRSPRLEKALLVGSDAVDLYFDVDINLTTVNQGLNLSLVAGPLGSDFVYFCGAPPGVANVSVDAGNKRKVMLRNMTVSPQSDGSDVVNVDTGNSIIQNDLDVWPIANNLQNRWVPIVPEGVEVTSVSVNRATVGCNINGLFAYSGGGGNLKADNTNKLTITFLASGGVPYKFRIVNKDTNQRLGVDAQNAGGVVQGYEISEAPFGAPGPADLTAAGNVVTVPAGFNASGLVQLSICFDSLTQVGLGASEEGTLQIQASMDEFGTKTTADVKMDRKSPSIVLSGDNKAKSLNRTTVKLQFNEEMDRTAAERLFVDNGGGVLANANNGVRDANEPAIYRLRNMNNLSLISVKGVSVDTNNKAVTLTTDLIPVGVNLGIEVLGTTGTGAPNPNADATNREGAMDAAGNYISTNNDVYVNSNTFPAASEEITSVTATNEDTRRNYIADNGILRTVVYGPENLGNVWIQAVDADDDTTILSTAAVAQAMEVSPGLYRNTTMQLTTGITARAVVVRSCTDQTFAMGVVASNEVIIDNVRPKVASAAYVDAFCCTVTFDEPVLVAGAEAGINYIIPGLQVSNVATLDLITEETVTLTVTTMTIGTTYVVDVGAAVQDLAGNGINSGADSIGVDRASFVAGVEPLSVSRDSVEVAVDGSTTVTVSGGLPPYSVTASGTATAILEADGVTVTITGVSEGGATVTVSDSAIPASTAVITVTVTAAGGPIDPPTEQKVEACDATCQATAPMTVAGGLMDANFDYTAPVEVIAGVMSEDFLTVWWLTDSCTLSTGFEQAATDSMLFSCTDVAMPAGSEQGWVFWLVAPSDTADMGSDEWWITGVYELMWYQP